MAFEQLDSLFVTDVGRAREINEDAVLALPQYGVFCVADGMGGAEGGEIASRIVIDHIRQAFENNPAPQYSSLDVHIETLRRAVELADTDIKDWAAEHNTTGTGTTLVATVFDPQCAFFGSVLHAGDSRAYRYRAGVLSRLSKDHSVATALGLDDEQNLPSLFHGVITHAIGAQEGKNLEENTFDVEDDDVFLLCSDGLTRMLQDLEIEDAIREYRTEGLVAVSSRLVAAANAKGGLDNISVGLIRVKPADGGTAAEPPAPPAPREDPEPAAPAEEASTVDEAVSRFLAQREALPAAPPSSPPVTPSTPPAADTAPETEAPPETPETPEPAAPPPPEIEIPKPSTPSPVIRPIPTPVTRPAFRYRRILLAGLILFAAIAAAAALLYLARALPGMTDAKAAPGKSAPGNADGAASEQATADVHRLVQETLETGRWGELKLALLEDVVEAGKILRKANLNEVYPGWLRLSEKVRYDEIYRSWLYLWEKIRYADSGEASRAAYTAYCKSMQQLHKALGGAGALDVKTQWPDSPELQADFVCRESYRLQKALLENAALRIDEFNNRFSAFQGDRPAILKALGLMTTGDPASAGKLGTAILEAESRILALHKWIGMRGSFPLDPEVLDEMAGTTFPAMSKSVRTVGELLRESLGALSAESIRRGCGKNGITDAEVENLLILRDRLLRPAQPSGGGKKEKESESAADWFNSVNVEQLRFFLRRLSQKCKA